MASSVKKKRNFLPNFRDKIASPSSDKSGTANINKDSGQNSANAGKSNNFRGTTDANRVHRDPKIGDVVYFGELKGIIRYIGTTHFAPANTVYCGLELYTPSGKNDGAVEGVRYFQCPSKFGLFVSLDRVSFKPSKEAAVAKSARNYQNIMQRSDVDLNEVKRKTSSLRDPTAGFGSSYVRNDVSQTFQAEKSLSNDSMNQHVYAPSSLGAFSKSSRHAPKTPPSSKKGLTNQQQFLRTQSVPKLPTADSNQTQSNNAPSGLNNGSPHDASVAVSGSWRPPVPNDNPNNPPNNPGLSKLEKLLRPKSSRGNVVKPAAVDSTSVAHPQMQYSKRHSITENQVNMSDMTLLIRDKQMQGSVPTTPLGDGSPGSALRQAQYLFTCPSPTPDRIVADCELGIATDTFVIESEDHYEVPSESARSPAALVTLNMPDSNNSLHYDSQAGCVVNVVPHEESGCDKTENYLETIPEAENSIANTLDRLADRRSLNSEDSVCIPSRRTSPDGSCDNSIDVNYGNRFILAQPIKVPEINKLVLNQPLKLNGSEETVSGSDEDFNEDNEKCGREQKQLFISKDLCLDPRLPQSLTSSCANLCDHEAALDEENGNDDMLLADVTVTFSTQSDLSDEDDDEDPYCLIKEGVTRMKEMISPNFSGQ